MSHSDPNDRHADRARAELRWFFTEAAGELGLHAAAIEPQSRAAQSLASPGPSTRALRAADRARRIREILHRLPTETQAILAAAHAELPPAIVNEPALRQDRDVAAQMGVALALHGRTVLAMKAREIAQVRTRAQRQIASALELFTVGWRESLATWRPLHVRWDDA